MPSIKSLKPYTEQPVPLNFGEQLAIIEEYDCLVMLAIYRRSVPGGPDEYFIRYWCDYGDTLLDDGRYGCDRFMFVKVHPAIIRGMLERNITMYGAICESSLLPYVTIVDVTNQQWTFTNVALEDLPSDYGPEENALLGDGAETEECLRALQ